MADIILHHYPGSPYSEKVRGVLGYKRLRWKSVIIPALLPKPDVIALTGGNRRTPFLQIGGHIYCDTNLICRVLERLAPEPSIFPYGDNLATEAICHFADRVLVNIRPPISSMDAEGLRRFFPEADDPGLERYRKDRTAMRQGSPKGHSLPPPDILRELLVSKLDTQFADGRPFLLGAQPSIADFAAYHTCWVVERIPRLASDLLSFPRIAEWMDRIRSFGHGRSTELSSDEAIDIARRSAIHAAEAKFGADPDNARRVVDIVPLDGGPDSVRGELIEASKESLVVLYPSERAGMITIHFPRMAYDIRERQ